MSTTIFAHRGASKYAPENTIAAFQLAYDLGAEGIETDVHLTKDHIPVLIHDEHVLRTTDSVGYIKDFTYAELERLDAGSWFSNSFAGERILSLEQFLQWIKPKQLKLNIELKNNKINYQNLESIVYELIEHYKLQERTIISTFNKKSVQRLKRMNKAIEIALLTSKRNKNLIQHTKELGANALHIKYRLLSKKLINQAHHENISVRVYTINKVTHMLNCFSKECDGIFTDIPDLGIKTRKKYYSVNN